MSYMRRCFFYKVEVFRILCYNLRYEYRKNGGTASFRTGKSD